MYVQRQKATESQPIRKISPKAISNSIHIPPCTPENWQSLVSIVMKLVHDKKVKDLVISDLSNRIATMETTLENGIFPREKSC